MLINDDKIHQYVIQHTSPENPILEELVRETHLKMINPRMLSGHLQGALLSMLSQMVQAQNILEIGTFTAYSTICLAKGLPLNGTLHTIELNPEQETIIRKYLKKAQIEKQVKLHIGNAIEIIPTLNTIFELAFIDADKKQYIQYYELTLKNLKEGGYIIIDNVLWDGKVVRPIENEDKETQAIVKFNEYIQNDSRVENIMLPIRDGLSLIRKK